MYTIIDIETTGNGIKGNKITEISIFKFNGIDIVEEFTSLVDPECEIPYFITGLTGIDNDMVKGAPKIHEIAPKVLDITADTIFVAHSVNFDYNVIKNEFKEIGIDFNRKKLCTVRLSRKLLPGYRSYSLGKLCSVLGIPLTDRHRARGDAHATLLLFRMLMDIEGAAPVFKSFLNMRSQEATLPPALPRETFDKLPTEPGVYYFKNSDGKIIYVGKAINIKKRILGHFYDKTSKEVRLCRETADIDYELSGSELLALLMESAAIKHHFPKYNSAQKSNTQAYGIFAYEDRNGIMHLAYNKVKMISRPIAQFNNPTDCRTYLEEVCKQFELCPKYCHLQENIASCSHYRIDQCRGVCRGKESAAHYNGRVAEALEALSRKNENLVIKEQGRTLSEEAFVLIKDGHYRGYGFLDKHSEINSEADLEAFLKPQKNSMDSQRIINAYLNKKTTRTWLFSESMGG